MKLSTLIVMALLPLFLLGGKKMITLTGAKADGITNDSAVIQKAIDNLPENGTLVIPPGNYICGGIKLKSHMKLYLSAGVVITGSDKINDYFDWTPWQHKRKQTALGRALFFGGNIEDVTIEGPGVINGNGHKFWDYDGERSGDRFELLTDGTKVYKRHALRPVPMLFFNCRDVKLYNFTIINSAAYTVWTIGCDRVLIDTVTVRNHRFGPNTDVLDIDCSADVTIRNCDLDAGDDTIALKSDHTLLSKEKACERILVENCRLSSSTCAVRTGYEGDSPIRDCIFRNITITNTRDALNFISVIPVNSMIRKGARIENMTFSNITMKNVGRPIYIWSGVIDEKDEKNYTGYIRNITFENIKAEEAVNVCFFGGNNVSDIKLKNVDITLLDNHCRHNRPIVTKPTVWSRGYLPEIINTLNTELSLENVTTRVIK